MDLTAAFMYDGTVSVGREPDRLGWLAVEVLLGPRDLLGALFIQAVGRAQFHAFAALGCCFLAGCQLEVVRWRLPAFLGLWPLHLRTSDGGPRPCHALNLSCLFFRDI